MTRALLLAIWLCATLAPSGALAARFDSAYTDLDFDQCTIVHADDFSVVRACPGFKGIPVMVVEDDARFFVSFGLDSTHETAAKQTFSSFNTLGKTMEWRLTNASGRWKPFATILRWSTDEGEGGKGEFLVVTKVEPDHTCQIARIDAKKADNANELARQVADEEGLDFDCEKDSIRELPE